MKRIIVLLLLLFMAHGVWAQVQFDVPLPKSLRTVSTKDKNGNERKIKFQVGGNFGVVIGTLMGIELQPKFAVLPCQWVSIGLTGSYIFRWDVISNRVSHTFGVSPYVEGYFFQKQLVLHAAYEYVNFPVVTYDPVTLGEVDRFRSSSHVVLVGGGYNKSITEHSGISAIVLFPVYQHNSDNIRYYNTWYTPIVRIGYNYSF